MAEAYDVVVVGAGGAMGSSAVMRLALRGARVLGLDRFVGTDGRLHGHDRGSSHGSSRMIRMCYYEHADYVPLLRRAYELWPELEARAGWKPGTLFRITGGIYMGPAGCEAVEGSRRAAMEHGLEHQMLTHAALAARYPQFRLPGDFVGLYEPMAGYLRPEGVVEAQLRVAREHGAELRGGERVVRWMSEGRSVRVVAETERGEVDYAAKSLVLAPGAWAGRLNEGVKVTATRQVLGWVRPRNPGIFSEPEFGVWAIDAAHLGEGFYYGFPMEDESHGDGVGGLKIARHARGAITDPDRNDWEARAGDEETFRPCLRRWMPEADGPVETMRICMYENSPDGHFIVDRHPMHTNVVVACGFSGHGFKFASVVGEVVAEMVMEGKTRWPVGFLGMGRFG